MSQRNVTSESRAASVPVLSLAGVDNYLSGFARHDAGYFSRRSGTFIMVTALHAILFYGLITTLSHIRAGANPPPLQIRPIDSPHPREIPPATPPPQLDTGKIETPIPEFSVPGDPDAGREATTTTGPISSQPISPSITAHVPAQVRGGPGVGFPDPDDFYPPLARRMEEQGSATVQVCVDAKGRLTADPSLLEGSGSAGLDGGALKLARAGSGHYRASTEDGLPVNSCYPLRIRFQIKR